MSYTHPSILITGASSGLGEEFAKQLAPNSKEIILVARRANKLDELKKHLLTINPSLNVHCEAIDLIDDKAIQTLINKINSGTYNPNFLINNAGMGDLGSFKNSDWEKVHAMVKLNMEVLTRLTLACIPSLSAHSQSYLLNVSSLASTFPIPDFAVYAATKAYVTFFSEAIRMELKAQNTAVTALCPGPIHTEFGTVADRTKKNSNINLRDWAFVSKKQCVSEAISAVLKNKPTVFPSIKVRLFALLFRLTPMPILRVFLTKRPRKID